MAQLHAVERGLGAAAAAAGFIAFICTFIGGAPEAAADDGNPGLTLKPISGFAVKKIGVAANWLGQGPSHAPDPGWTGPDYWDWSESLSSSLIGTIPVKLGEYNPAKSTVKGGYVNQSPPRIFINKEWLRTGSAIDVLALLLHEYAHAAQAGYMNAQYGCPLDTISLDSTELAALSPECASYHCHLNVETDVPGDGTTAERSPCLEAQAESYVAEALCEIVCSLSEDAAGPNNPKFSRELAMQAADAASVEANALIAGCMELTSGGVDGQGQPIPPTNNPSGDPPPPSCKPMPMVDPKTGMAKLPSEMGEVSQCCCDCNTMMPMDCPDDCDEDGKDDKEQIKEVDEGDGPDLDANDDGVLDGTPCDCDGQDDEGEGQ